MARLFLCFGPCHVRKRPTKRRTRGLHLLAHGLGLLSEFRAGVNPIPTDPYKSPVIVPVLSLSLSFSPSRHPPPKGLLQSLLTSLLHVMLAFFRSDLDVASGSLPRLVYLFLPSFTGFSPPERTQWSSRTSARTCFLLHAKRR